MRVYTNIEQRTEDWFELRKGKVTGTRLAKILSERKDAQEAVFYETVAERLSTVTAEEAEELAMQRGSRIEDEAVAEFERRSKKKVERVGFVESSFSPWAGYSPDALIKRGGKYTEDVEVKCLASGNHVRAWLTGKIPPEYRHQIVQGFVVNDDLKVRHVVFYDPRIPTKPYVCIDVTREECRGEIEAARAKQIEFINRVEALVASLIKL